MPTILEFTDEKKHSVRYDYNGKDFRMTVYVPKGHPVLAKWIPWTKTLNLELSKGE